MRKLTFLKVHGGSKHHSSNCQEVVNTTLGSSKHQFLSTDGVGGSKHRGGSKHVRCIDLLYYVFIYSGNVGKGYISVTSLFLYTIILVYNYIFLIKFILW